MPRSTAMFELHQFDPAHSSLATIMLVFWTVLLAWFLLRKKNLPPGPRGWPIVGCLPYLTGNIHEDLEKLGQNYQDLFSLYLGNRLTIILKSDKAFREAFTKKGLAFASKPFEPHVSVANPGFQGTIFGTYSEEWKREKKFCITSLKRFGYGSTSLEDKLVGEINELKRELVAFQDGRPCDVAKMVELTMCNIMVSILFNKRWSADDENYKKIITSMNQWMQIMARLMTEINYFPLLRFLPSKRKTKVIQLTSEIKNFFKQEIAEHRASFNPDVSRDFIDEILHEIGPDGTSSTLLGKYDDERFSYALFSFFPDAVDTAPAVVKWLFLYTVYFPEVQDKVHEELDRVIGREQPPSLAHRRQLPYVEAVIAETLRFSNVVPLNPTHCCVEDTELLGYTIPKNADVIGNFSAIHNSQEIWGDPEKFRPERFLNSNGEFVKHDSLIPFSVGRRSCLGEQLAKKEFFLIYTTLLQGYAFEFPKDEPLPSLTGEFGFTIGPRKYKLCVKPRDAPDTQ